MINVKISDLARPRFKANPYPFYARLRAEAPVCPTKFLGEPTWLHLLSPGAHATRRDLGWTERGPTLRGLRRDLRAAGFGEMRRFFEPTRPYGSRVRGLGWQLARLVGANAWTAPGVKNWLAARRSG